LACGVKAGDIWHHQVWNLLHPEEAGQRTWIADKRGRQRAGVEQHSVRGGGRSHLLGDRQSNGRSKGADAGARKGAAQGPVRLLQRDIQIRRRSGTMAGSGSDCSARRGYRLRRAACLRLLQAAVDERLRRSRCESFHVSDG